MDSVFRTSAFYQIRDVGNVHLSLDAVIPEKCVRQCRGLLQLLFVKCIAPAQFWFVTLQSLDPLEVGGPMDLQ